jgi:hypothetical protein
LKRRSTLNRIQYFIPEERNSKLPKPYALKIQRWQVPLKRTSTFNRIQYFIPEERNPKLPKPLLKWNILEQAVESIYLAGLGNPRW